MKHLISIDVYMGISIEILYHCTDVSQEEAKEISMENIKPTIRLFVEERLTLTLDHAIPLA